MMNGLLIEFDLNSGKRAGDIDPRDPKLPCHGWQNLNTDPALEIRLVEDDRDLSIYEGVSGVTILNGEKAINDAIDAFIPTRYGVFDISLMIEHMKQRGIPLDTFAGKDMKQIAQEASDLNLAGVKTTKPKKVK